MNANRKIRAFFDGCCEPVNPGGTMGFGAVVYNSGREIWHASGISRPQDSIHQTTSNAAEYAGLLAVLWGLIELGYQRHEIEICGDSQLVIRQMQGKWRICSGAYIGAALEARELLK